MMLPCIGGLVEKKFIYLFHNMHESSNKSQRREWRKKIWLICYFSTRSAPRGGKLISIASANLRLSANDLTTWCEVMWFHLLLLLQQPSLIFFFYIKFDSHSLFALSLRRDDVEWKGQDHDLCQRAEENRNWRDSKTLFFCADYDVLHYHFRADKNRHRHGGDRYNERNSHTLWRVIDYE